MSSAEVVRRIGRIAQPLVPRSRNGLVVLAYHLVGAGTGSPVDIDERLFHDQMETLAENERVLSLTHALAELESSGTIRRSAYVITFDDAYANFAEVALPVLQSLGLPAILYVPCDFISGTGTPPIRGTEDLSPCSWSTLREITATGLVEIGSHTLSHRDLPGLDEREAEREIRGSRERLEEELGREVTSFCYPRGAWTNHLERIVARHYSSSAVAGGTRVHRAGERCTRLTRYPVRADTPANLGPIRERRIWTEEYLADIVRRLRT